MSPRGPSVSAASGLAVAPEAPPAATPPPPVLAPPVVAAPDRPAAGRLALRIGAFTALLCIALTRWFALLGGQPPAGRALGFVAVAVAAATALALTGRLPLRAVRIAARAAIIAILILAALLIGGIPLRLLDHPHSWDTLGAGIGDGFSALPGVNVPYRGANEWVRIVTAAGGCLLAGLAAILAGWPVRDRLGRILAPLVVVGVLFAVPAVQIGADEPWLDGAAFAIPLVAFVLAERLTVRLAPLAGGLLVAAVLAALILAPRIDADRPVIDAQKLLNAFEPARPDQFNWNHGYGPLDWPRDGRVLLRVQARRPAYWKAENLDEFDGTGWRVTGEPPSLGGSTDGMADHPQWRQRVRVTIGAMRSPQFIGAGQTLGIDRAPHKPVASLAGGGFVSADGPLNRGDAYLADVYTPRPSPEEMRAAPQRAVAPQYEQMISDELSMRVNGHLGPAQIDFRPFHSGQSPIAIGPVGDYPSAVQLLDEAGYGRMYRLATRLAAESATPYDFARNVERYLGQSRFLYDEQPPVSNRPIPDFLFKTFRGYCQHFSGAMALLMRMGGVPARIAAGFTPGELDRDRGEYVVRDIDAHSWVEVWFTGIGWVTFDPTPADAPARAQSTISGTLPSDDVPHGSAAVPHQRGADVGPETAPAQGLGNEQDSSSAPLAGAILGGLAALLAGLFGGRALLRRRRGHPGGTPPDIAELERALRRTGRRPPPPTTLVALEQRFGHTPEARAYVRAVRGARYGRDAAGPTAAQRRALRRELSAGLGATGRLRALWALPPRRPGPQ